MNNVVLECQSIGVQIDGKWLLNPFTFSLSSGELMVLGGHNGAGKSTLLNALVGLVGSVGQILWMGEELSHLPPWQRVRKGIVLLSQQSIGFNELTLRQNIKMSGIGTAAYADLISRCGLLPFENRKWADLSGGERKRAEIARTLALMPRLWLLDEPFASLDTEHVEWMLKILREEQLNGAAIIVSDHQSEIHWTPEDRTIVLSNGSVVRQS